MRHNCQILIFIDLQKALEGELGLQVAVVRLHLLDKLCFYRSANNVILSPGNGEGVILPKYFKQVQEQPSGRLH